MTIAEFKKEIWDFDKQREWKYLGDKSAIVELYVTWSPQCKKLNLILDELYEEYAGKLSVHRIDVDKEPEIAKLFFVTTFPLMVFIPREGKPIQILGVFPKEQIQELIETELGVRK